MNWIEKLSRARIRDATRYLVDSIGSKVADFATIFPDINAAEYSEAVIRASRKIAGKRFYFVILNPGGEEELYIYLSKEEALVMMDTLAEYDPILAMEIESKEVE